MSTPSGLTVFEDDHVLVVDKPAGWNTHAPSPHAGEGIYDWLRHREPRWASLAILHRLDRDTSGLLVFGKTPLANQSLTAQFTAGQVTKRYRLRTRADVPARPFLARSWLVRDGDTRRSRSSAPGDLAETRFEPAGETGGFREWIASPLTGRTHQIRVHAADHGMPITGDPLYGTTDFPRLCLHAESLGFAHPVDGRPMEFKRPARFDDDPRDALRAAVIDPAETTAFRRIHGAADGHRGCYLDQLGGWRLVSVNEECAEVPASLAEWPGGTGVYQRRLNRQVRRTDPASSSPQLLAGSAAPERFEIRENGIRFELTFGEGYSVGLFLDQRDNRRRLLTGHVAAGFELRPPGTNAGDRVPPAGFTVLNCFAYTCAFSVCAAHAGAVTTSLDLSRKYLDWGRRNFTLNGLDPSGHDFIYGDCFDWMRRLARKGRRFDLVILDPPTFSQSRESGVFRVENDYGALVQSTLPLLNPGGVLLSSTNAARLDPADFLATVRSAIQSGGRRITAEHYVPQPPDFPVTRAEPAYLKTWWTRVQ